MCEAADAVHIARAMDAGRGLERRRVNLQPTPFRFGYSRVLPSLEVGAATGRERHRLSLDGESRLEPNEDAGRCGLNADAWVARHQRDAVGLEVRNQRCA